jgi:RimJ/RimL family protein N-acetyltransferase
MEDAERFMAEAQWELLTGTTAHCAIVAGSGFATSDPDVTEGTLLGSVNLVHYPEREAGEIGCWVVEGARGRHVASSAIRLIVRFAFEEVGLERLEIMTETPNLASQQMTEKLGFKREGNLRGYLASRGERDDELVDPAHGRIDQFMFALLRKEWEATDG